MIHPTAIIHPGVVIEEGVMIGPYCVIGGPPEDKKYFDKKPEFGVLIKNGVRLSEFVTVHAGTIRDTTIEEGSVIFQKTHVAHDCFIQRNSIVGGMVSLAGHTIIMEGANVSGKAATIPYIVLGAFSFIGANSLVINHVPPGEKWVGFPARNVGKNDIGMSRAGLDYDMCLQGYLPEFNGITYGRKV